MEAGPDYSKYSRSQLLDAYRNIDKTKYPERTQIILDELEKRPKESSTQIQEEKKNKNRQISIVISAYQFALGAIGLVYAFTTLYNQITSTQLLFWVIIVFVLIFYCLTIYAGFRLSKLHQIGIKLSLIVQSIYLVRFNIFDFNFEIQSFLNVPILIELPIDISLGLSTNLIPFVNILYQQNATDYFVGINLVALIVIYYLRKLKEVD